MLTPRTRSLFPAWVLIAVLWAAGVLGVAWIKSDAMVPSLTHGCEEIREFFMFGNADVAACEAVWRRQRLILIEWIVIPPIALLAAGMLIFILRDFRREK